MVLVCQSQDNVCSSVFAVHKALESAFSLCNTQNLNYGTTLVFRCCAIHYCRFALFIIKIVKLQLYLPHTSGVLDYVSNTKLCQHAQLE